MMTDGGNSTTDGGSSEQAPPAPLACDGALCDTSNGAECNVARRSLGNAPAPLGWLGPLAAIVLLGALRRKSRQPGSARRKRTPRNLVASVAVIAMVASRTSAAEPPPPVDVIIRDPPPHRRLLALEWNPLPLVTLGKLSGNLVVVPIDHHALIVSPFYARTSTEPIYIYDDAGNGTQLPEQKFHGFGAEIGYRYYVGLGGPRGFFAGPALVLGSFTATAANGGQTRFSDYGFAGDLGYEALVADAFAISLGAGVQYVTTSQTIPDQQFPAQIYANRGVRPRLLVSFGWAL
jgi:hypothetical protein